MQQTTANESVAVRIRQELSKIRSLLERDSTPAGERILVGIERSLDLCDLLPVAPEGSNPQSPEKVKVIEQFLSHARSTSFEFQKAFRANENSYRTKLTFEQFIEIVECIARRHLLSGQTIFHGKEIREIMMSIAGPSASCLDHVTPMLRSAGVCGRIDGKPGNAGSQLSPRFLEIIGHDKTKQSGENVDPDR